MAWVKIDDNFSEHPKLVEAGPLAMAMQIAALCYSNRHLTDGKLPRKIVARLMPTICYDPETGEPISWQEVAASLVEVGVWEETENGDFLIHDYLEYQPSKDEVIEIREKRKEAGRKGGKAKAKQSAKQNASKMLSKTPSKKEAKVCPVPVPQPVPDPVPEPDHELPPQTPPEDEVLVTWVNTFGDIGPFQAAKLSEWSEVMDKTLMTKAIEITKNQVDAKAVSGPPFQYAIGILRSWNQKGITSLEALDDYQKVAKARGQPKSRESPAKRKLRELGVISGD